MGYMVDKERNMAAAAERAKRKSEEGIWETVKVILQALLIAFVIRTFFYQPFNIPSASMYPTLKEGDYLFVSKLSYGYSKYSFNFQFGLFGQTWIDCCPVDFAGRKVWEAAPARGDVAVFKLPKDTKVDYIKRVIGLPGDRVQMKQGILHINGAPVKKERVADFVDRSGEGKGAPVRQFRETLPNGVSYLVLDGDPDGTGAADNTDEYIVPDNRFFMMGDNRDNSQDSRFVNAVGFVPYENFVGRADIIFFSIEKDTKLFEPWTWPFMIRWGRFFNLID
jgi:signal peptidase I